MGHDTHIKVKCTSFGCGTYIKMVILELGAVMAIQSSFAAYFHYTVWRLNYRDYGIAFWNIGRKKQKSNLLLQQ